MNWISSTNHVGTQGLVLGANRCRLTYLRPFNRGVRCRLTYPHRSKCSPLKKETAIVFENPLILVNSHFKITYRVRPTRNLTLMATLDSPLLHRVLNWTLFGLFFSELLELTMLRESIVAGVFTSQFSVFSLAPAPEWITIHAKPHLDIEFTRADSNRPSQMTA